MKKGINKLFKSVEEGDILGVVVMIVVVFSLVYFGTRITLHLADRSNMACKYVGKFWVDDSQDPAREGDFRGCFTMKEMYEMGRM